MEEYFCEFVLSADNVPPESTAVQTGIIKFFNDIIHFRHPDSGDVILEIPYKCIANFVIVSVNPELSSKFRKGTENILVLTIHKWQYPIYLSSIDISNLSIDIKKLISRSEQYQSTISSKMNHETPLIGKLYNGITLTKKLTLTAKELSLNFISDEESLIHREIPFDQLSGWTVIIKSIGNDVPVMITSAPPKTAANMDFIRELSSIICIDSGAKIDKSTKGNDSGSDTEVVFSE